MENEGIQGPVKASSEIILSRTLPHSQCKGVEKRGANLDPMPMSADLSREQPTIRIRHWGENPSSARNVIDLCQGMGELENWRVHLFYLQSSKCNVKKPKRIIYYFLGP